MGGEFFFCGELDFLKKSNSPITLGRGEVGVNVDRCISLIDNSRARANVLSAK